jgi:hypothetical protein
MSDSSSYDLPAVGNVLRRRTAGYKIDRSQSVTASLNGIVRQLRRSGAYSDPPDGIFKWQEG